MILSDLELEGPKSLGDLGADFIFKRVELFVPRDGSSHIGHPADVNPFVTAPAQEFVEGGAVVFSGKVQKSDLYAEQGETRSSG